jgi:hypothetical protein
MSILDNLSGKLPFLHKEENTEYFFGLNIGAQKVKACLWLIDGNHLKVVNTVFSDYSSSSQLLEVSDQLLDQVLGTLPFEPEKILFGVPDAWLQDDDLKEEYLKVLRGLVKALEIKPLAYVATSHALTHFLEKDEGAPITAIIVGIDEDTIAVTVSRAGKVDGTKVVKRGSNLGQDIEKTLLGFSDVEVLPSRILIYGNPQNLSKQKQELSSFPWMNKLSFLHLPKIEVLEPDVDMKAVAFAGAIELNTAIKYIPNKEESLPIVSPVKPVSDEEISMDNLAGEGEPKDLDTKQLEDSNLDEVDEATAAELGFVSGDVTKSESQIKPEEGEVQKTKKTAESEDLNLDQDLPEDLSVGRHGLGDEETAVGETETRLAPRKPLPIDEYESGLPAMASTGMFAKVPRFKIPTIPKARLLIPLIVIILLVASYFLFSKATVIVFVEPKILENDTQVTADPNIKQVDEEAKKIPGSFVETQVSGSEKMAASGQKQVGDPAKGTVVIYNKATSSKTISKGTVLTAQNGLKFTLDSDIKIASQSATQEGITFGKANGNVVAQSIGADGNLPSDTTFTVGGISANEVSAKAEGNFSGGTSKQVTVVTDSDQKKLLASLASNLRKQATDQLQAKLSAEKDSTKKILQEALNEEIIKKSFNKNIGDQASEFSLNLTINYKGLAYSDNDLKTIVGKLVQTNVPDNFQLDLADTETSADVSKVEKDKLTFLARFKAKLVPKVDNQEIKKQIVGKTPLQVADILKTHENVLGSDIKLTPPLPAPLARLPFITQNIKVEVSLK